MLQSDGLEVPFLVWLCGGDMANEFDASQFQYLLHLRKDGFPTSFCQVDYLETNYLQSLGVTLKETDQIGGGGIN